MVVLVYLETKDGAVAESSLSALSAAGALAGPVHAWVEGPVDPEALRPYGVEKVFNLQDERLRGCAPRALARALHETIVQRQPAAVLAASTPEANEVLARVAALGEWGLATACTALEPAGEALNLTRALWGGSLLQQAQLVGTPRLLTVEPAAFPPTVAGAPGAAELEPLSVELDEADFVDRRVRVEQGERQGIPLASAKVVIGGGRGVGSEEGFRVLEELAALVHGAVGGSRVATNNGWRPHSDQIGQTGAQIAPDVYIPCGISGAIQHMVGCKSAKNIIAINKDPDAPIFQRSNYGIVGDLHEVVPALIEAIRRARG